MSDEVTRTEVVKSLGISSINYFTPERIFTPIFAFCFYLASSFPMTKSSDIDSLDVVHSHWGEVWYMEYERNKSTGD